MISSQIIMISYLNNPSTAFQLNSFFRRRGLNFIFLTTTTPTSTTTFAVLKFQFIYDVAINVMHYFFLTTTPLPTSIRSVILNDFLRVLYFARCTCPLLFCAVSTFRIQNCSRRFPFGIF